MIHYHYQQFALLFHVTYLFYYIYWLSNIKISGQYLNFDSAKALKIVFIYSNVKNFDILANVCYVHHLKLLDDTYLCSVSYSSFQTSMKLIHCLLKLVVSGLLKLVVSANARFFGEIFKDLITLSKNELNPSANMPSLKIVLPLFFKVILEDVSLCLERKSLFYKIVYYR